MFYEPYSATQENANRLKAYKSKLVVFPRRSKKPKQGDASAEELSTVQQQHARRVLPIAEEKAEPELVTISSDLKVCVASSQHAVFVQAGKHDSVMFHAVCCASEGTLGCVKWYAFTEMVCTQVLGSFPI